uniref:Uncharacterized protein n=1 Tax=Anguilla anguilla TaxID=7936 RepID=A0A0E9W0C8_ANGAN
MNIRLAIEKQHIHINPSK